MQEVAPGALVHPGQHAAGHVPGMSAYRGRATCALSQIIGPWRMGVRLVVSLPTHAELSDAFCPHMLSCQMHHAGQHHDQDMEGLTERLSSSHMLEAPVEEGTSTCKTPQQVTTHFTGHSSTP